MSLHSEPTTTKKYLQGAWRELHTKDRKARYLTKLFPSSHPPSPSTASQYSVTAASHPEWVRWHCILIVVAVQNIEQSLKTTRSIGVRSRILLMKTARLFLQYPKKIEDFHKEIRQPNEAQNFRRLKCATRHVPNRSETTWIFVFGGYLSSFK